MQLIVVHYHFRPGGVRRVIELALPHLAKALKGELHQILLVGGEAPEEAWLSSVRENCRSVPVLGHFDSSFGYFSEQKRKTPQAVRRRIRETWNALLDRAAEKRDPITVWFHNPGVGRNILLADETFNILARRNIRIVAHHHDWWFEHRWPRWAELKRCGFDSIPALARAVFPSKPDLRQVFINQRDYQIAARHDPKRSAWLPNLTDPAPAVSKARLNATRAWLRAEHGWDGRPMWIIPCRALRRKNLAEAILLARWLNPEAWIFTTGGISSAAEKDYGTAISEKARHGQWRFQIGVLQSGGDPKPSVHELLSLSQAVLLTSVQEGFGLPYLEAAAAGRPLLARRLANISPDLEMFGFRFPYAYDDLMIHPTLFNWRKERARQGRLFSAWQKQLPMTCRRWVSDPVICSAAEEQPMAFSSLTLQAQMEVLEKPRSDSWPACVPFNSFLEDWELDVQRNRLQPTQWPAGASRWLGGENYGLRLAELLEDAPVKSGIALPSRLQHDFICDKLQDAHRYPLLW